MVIQRVCSSCLQFSRGAEGDSTFSEFDKGTRNLQLLWTNIQPSSCCIKIISLVLSSNSSSWSSHHLLVLYHCVFVCYQRLKTEQDVYLMEWPCAVS